MNIEQCEAYATELASECPAEVRRLLYGEELNPEGFAEFFVAWLQEQPTAEEYAEGVEVTYHGPEETEWWAQWNKRTLRDAFREFCE